MLSISAWWSSPNVWVSGAAPFFVDITASNRQWESQFRRMKYATYYGLAFVYPPPPWWPSTPIAPNFDEPTGDDVDCEWTHPNNATFAWVCLSKSMRSRLTFVWLHDCNPICSDKCLHMTCDQPGHVTFGLNVAQRLCTIPRACMGDAIAS